MVQCVTITMLAPGKVTFISVPPGAKIFIAPTGQPLVDQNKITPDTVTDLIPGLYDYKLTLAGYKDKTDTFIITDGLPPTVDTTLEPVSAEMGLGLFLVAGLAIGYIILASKKKK